MNANVHLPNIVMEHLMLAKVLHNLKKRSGDWSICIGSLPNRLLLCSVKWLQLSSALCLVKTDVDSGENSRSTTLGQELFLDLSESSRLLPKRTSWLTCGLMEERGSWACPWHWVLCSHRKGSFLWTRTWKWQNNHGLAYSLRAYDWGKFPTFTDLKGPF